VGLRIAGLEFQRPAIGGDGFLDPALSGQCQAQIVMDLRPIRLELERLALTCDGLVQPVHPAIRFTQIGMRGEIVRG